MAEDLISVLIRDHHEVEEMFARLEVLAGSTDADALREEKTVAEKVVIELVRHSVAEEMYLYPTVQKVMPSGAELGEREVREQAEAEKTMNTLERLDPDDAAFDATVRTLVQQIRAHVGEEEDEIFPALQKALPRQELEQLGKKISTAKKTAPTRPHPAAPDHPPLNKVLAPGTGLVDRIRDVLTGRGR